MSDICVTWWAVDLVLQESFTSAAWAVGCSLSVIDSILTNQVRLCLNQSDAKYSFFSANQTRLLFILLLCFKITDSINRYIFYLKIFGDFKKVHCFWFGCFSVRVVLPLSGKRWYSLSLSLSLMDLNRTNSL